MLHRAARLGGIGTTVTLAAPTGLALSLQGSIPSRTIRVTWTDQSDKETGWEVQRRSAGGVFATVHTTASATEGATGGTVQWDDTDAAGKLYDTQYEYRVRATRGGSVSEWSGAVGIYTDAQAPVAPSWFSGYPVDQGSTEDYVLLRLQATTASHYLVYYRANQSMAGNPVQNGILLNGDAMPENQLVGTAYAHNIGEGTTGYWQVRGRAQGTNGRSVFGPFGPEGSATALPRTPGVPTTPTVALPAGPQVFVDWAAGSPDTATVYRLRRRWRTAGSADAWNEEALPTVSAPTTAYTDPAVIDGREYQYQVRAENVAGSSAYTAWSATVAVCTAPGQVTGVGVTTTGVVDPQTQLRVTWGTPSGTVSVYRIRYRVSGAPSWTETTDPASPRDLTGLVPGTNHEVQVRAENACGQVGAYSASVFASTQAAVPAAPTNVAATPVQATSSQLRVTWLNSPDATSHDVEWAQSVTQPASGTVVTGATTPWTLTGRPGNTSHWFRVRGVNAHGAGPWSGWVQAYTHVAVPASFAAIHDLDECPAFAVDLSWSNTNADGDVRSETMSVRRSNDGGQNWTVITSSLAAGSTSYRDTGGTGGATDRYGVRYNSAATWAEAAVNTNCPT